MTNYVQGDKRDRILKAAVRVFSQKGFHDAKVDEIAQMADVGKGTVYEYFTSKIEIFQEMLKNGLESYMQNVVSEITPGMTCREKLRLIAGLHTNFLIQSKDLARVIMTEQTFFNEDFRKWMSDHRLKRIEMIKGIIQEGSSSGEFRKVDPYAATLVFTGALTAMLSPVICDNEDINYEKLLEQTMDVLLNGLLK